LTERREQHEEIVEGRREDNSSLAGFLSDYLMRSEKKQDKMAKRLNSFQDFLSQRYSKVRTLQNFAHSPSGTTDDDDDDAENFNENLVRNCFP
jgi:hypothetical protein